MSKSNCPLRSIALPADPPFSQDQPRPDAAPLRCIGRPDSLTSQHIEVGLVLNAMLGFSAANDYLMRQEIDQAIIVRVLSEGGPRRGEHDASGIRLPHYGTN